MKKKVLLSCVCLAGILGIGLCYFRHVPTISVVMSTYNRAEHLPKAIDSIKNQTFQDWELIIVNDGSKDNTAEVLKEYAKQDRRIKILTNTENKGLVYSLNRGLDEAKGQFVARMDDDDVSLPYRFEKQYEFMKDNPEITVTSSFVGQPKNGRPWPFQQKINPEEMKIDLFLGTVPMSHPSLFVRNDFLKEHHIRYNDKYKAAEDTKFYLDLYDAGAKIGKVPDVLVLYRLHGENPSQFYLEQYQNTNLFLQDEILPRFGIQAQVTSRPPCAQFRQMVEANKTRHHLLQDSLEKAVEKKCPSNPVRHKLWSDSFVFKDNRVCRLDASKECGTILSQTDDSFSMKWDRWGVETFTKKDGIWFFQEQAPTEKEKKANLKGKKSPKKAQTSQKKKA